MTKLLRLFSIVVAGFAVTFSTAQADERASLDEAQAMAERAAEFLHEEGPDVAFPAFNEGGEWHDRDLYVFVFDLEGNAVAHGANESLIGTNMIEATDPEGNAFIADIVAVEDHGWVDYVFANPQTSENEPKRSYVIRVDDQYAVGVGAYVQ